MFAAATFAGCMVAFAASLARQSDSIQRDASQEYLRGENLSTTIALGPGNKVGGWVADGSLTSR